MTSLFSSGLTDCLPACVTFLSLAQIPILGSIIKILHGWRWSIMSSYSLIKGILFCRRVTRSLRLMMRMKTMSLMMMVVICRDGRGCGRRGFRPQLNDHMVVVRSLAAHLLTPGYMNSRAIMIQQTDGWSSWWQIGSGNTVAAHNPEKRREEREKRMSQKRVNYLIESI